MIVTHSQRSITRWILIGTWCLEAILLPPTQAQRSNDMDISLEKKIGQMLLVGFQGTRVTESHPIIHHIRENQIGGILLSEANIEVGQGGDSHEQIKRLTSLLQEVSPVPLFIAIDYEGGHVSRLKPEYGFSPTRSAKSLGLENNLLATRTQASAMAGLLEDLGINVNFAPVLDLAVNPKNPVIVKKNRSFSADPFIVTNHARAFIQAHHEKGILCAVKHFPGHGSSIHDTHQARTDITHTWVPEELIPFRKLISEGCPDFVMAAHVFHRRIDDANPATLSSKALTTILRGQLKYDGVILADDMHMRAIIQEYDLTHAVIRAINAGVDILVFTYNPNAGNNFISNIIDMVKKAVDEQLIPKERIDASYRRITKLKNRYFAP